MSKVQEVASKLQFSLIGLTKWAPEWCKGVIGEVIYDEEVLTVYSFNVDESERRIKPLLNMNGLFYGYTVAIKHGNNRIRFL